MSERLTRNGFKKQCRLKDCNGNCVKYSGTIMECDERCGYMVDEWAYYNRKMEEARNPYKESLNYITSVQLSRIIEENKIVIPTLSKYAWKIDNGYKTLTPYNKLQSYDSYYPAYCVTDVANVIREHYKIHINMFIDGGWTYSIEDFGNNELPVLTDYAWDTYNDALDVACCEVFKKLYNLDKDGNKN